MKNSNYQKSAIIMMITLCFVVMSSTLQASMPLPQQKAPTLTGKVADAYVRVGLADATVQIKGTDVKVVTAKDGTYSIDLPKGAKYIIVSHNGYKTVELEIKGRTVINVTMSQAGAASSTWQ
jgi:TonB-dependent starch-binding outer membrane protein SusC